MVMAINDSNRIYIGGLEPTRLSVEEVLQRVKDHIPDSFGLVNVHYSKEPSTACYVQFTVVSISAQEKELNQSNQSQSDDVNIEKSAFQLICKLFNNVKWKGCKLKVEQAKPHFLDRLRGEIQDRLNAFHESENIDIVTSSNIVPSVTTHIGRHLKVKKSYGEKYWKVDTKPLLVTDWNSFHNLRKLLRRKQQTYKQKIEDNKNANLKDTKKQKQNSGIQDNKQLIQIQEPHCRSVHLRFNDDEKIRSKNLDQDTKLDSHDAISDDKSDEYTAVSSEDESETKQAKGVTTTSTNVAGSSSNKDSYCWSSDDDSSHSYVEPTNEDEKTSENVHGQDYADENDTYYWSDDNSSHENEVVEKDTVPRPLNSELTKANEIDTNDGIIDKITPSDPDVDDIGRDVAFNLSILSGIFSDTGKSIESSKAGEKVNERKINPGWNGARMIRYDPNSEKVASESLIQIIPKDNNDEIIDNPDIRVEQDDEINQTSEEETTDEEMVDIDEKLNDTKSDPYDNDNVKQSGLEKNLLLNVYEQKKLEDAFRVTDDPPTFNFNFSLATSDTDSSVLNAPNVNDVQLPSESFDLGAPQSSANDSIAMSTLIDDQLLPDAVNRISRKRKRRLVHDFLDEDSELLDHYVRFSYYSTLGEGENIKILQELESYRNDDAIAEAWNEHRKHLTADWKSKQKYASNRKVAKPRHP